MFKAVRKFKKIMPIKAQLATLVTLSVLITSAWFAYSFLFQNPNNSQHQSEIERLLKNLDDSHINMSRHETNYFADPSENNIQGFHKNANDAIFFIDKLIPSAEGKMLHDLKFIRQRIFEYRQLFQKSVITQTSLGFAADQGLEKELNQAVNDIEAHLSALRLTEASLSEINKIIVEFMTLRRHERDFMLRLQPEYLIQFDKQIINFNSTLAASTVKPENKKQISKNIEIYSHQFEHWNQTALILDNELQQLDRAFGSFSPILQDLVIEYEIFGEYYDEQLHSSQRLSKIFLIVSSIIIMVLLLAMGIMVVLFRQHEKFKNVVRQRATLLKQATELERINAENVSLANIDTLTSLPNRRSFFNQLNNFIAQSSDKKIIVGLLDLDGFKRINDVFGHPTGDALLVKTSERLTDVLGKSITLARLGGDEFGLIITHAKDIKNVSEIGQAICDAMRLVFHLKEGSVQVAATVGFVEFPSMASNSQQMFERADYALCHSKQNSKGQAVIFSNDHKTIIRNKANIEHQLREADLDKELSVMFQPIVDIRLKKTIGFEALARWHNPSLGNIPPDIFINAAEQMGIIGKLTTILLRKSLAMACQWPDNIYLSFNLSIYDLSSSQTVLSLISLIENSQFPNHRIIFEITETAVMDDFKQASEALNLLKLQGVQIALDDFGTGYSSLSYVQKMPLDRLKIDRSFISDITEDNNTRNIVQTIVDLCNNLDLQCIVEGVETFEQLITIEEMGCRYVQGYYFSRPLSHTDALEFISNQTEITNKLKA